MKKSEKFTAKPGYFSIPLTHGTVSVGFTNTHYCTNRDKPFSKLTWESETAEVAVIDPKTDKFITSKFWKGINEDIIPYMTKKDFQILLDRVLKNEQISN